MPGTAGDQMDGGIRGWRHWFPAVKQQQKAAELECLKPNVRARCPLWCEEGNGAFTIHTS